LRIFGVELVAGVFGFFGLRVAAVEVEVVAEGAIGADLFAADFGGELRNEVPVGLLAGGNELPITRLTKTNRPGGSFDSPGRHRF
jgi:hypothetical protein